METIEIQIRLFKEMIHFKVRDPEAFPTNRIPRIGVKLKFFNFPLKPTI